MRKFVVFTETDRTISVNQIIADDLWAVEITKCLTLCVCSPSTLQDFANRTKSAFRYNSQTYYWKKNK